MSRSATTAANKPRGPKPGQSSSRRSSRDRLRNSRHGRHTPGRNRNPRKTWDEVQAILTRNRRDGGASVRNKHRGAATGPPLLRVCNVGMHHSYTRKDRPPLPLLRLPPGAEARLGRVPHEIGAGGEITFRPKGFKRPFTNKPLTIETHVRFRERPGSAATRHHRARRATCARGRPRIARLIALAIHFDRLIRNGTVRNYADLARLGGFPGPGSPRSWGY